MPKKKIEKTEEMTTVTPVDVVETPVVEEAPVEKAKPAKKAAPKTKKPSKKEAEIVSAEPNVEEKAAPKIHAARIRGKKYINARAYVDRTRTYPLDEAVVLAKKSHFAKFPGSLEVNLVLRGEEGVNVDVNFPFATGRSVSVAVATDELLKEIEKGVITFNILVAHPSMMPKLSKLARVLGPKGLMPNPKNGTLTPDPEKRKKELEGGAMTVKAEKKAPLVHVVIGKLSQPEKELSANLRALLKAYPAGKVMKCTIAATMGPGVKVRVE